MTRIQLKMLSSIMRMVLSVVVAVVVVVVVGDSWIAFGENVVQYHRMDKRLQQFWATEIETLITPSVIKS